VEGRIEEDDKFFRIAAVNLKYRLKIPRGNERRPTRARASRNYCPVHQSIKKGFEVTWSAEVEEGSR